MVSGDYSSLSFETGDSQMTMMMILVMMMSRVMTVSMSGMSRCCSNILINVDNPHSDIHTNQGARLGFYSQIGYYGARPQYKYN